MVLERLAAHLGAARCVGCNRSGAIACPFCRAAQPVAGRVTAPPSVDRVVAAWDYDGMARSLVLALKVRGRRAAAGPLAEAIASRVWAEGCSAEALLWVPGRRPDIRARGFDHARLIAAALSALVGIPAIPRLRRTGDRADQAGLNAAQRRANLEGAFRAHAVPTRVAIVDDVMTTGATVTEAARAARAAGAAYVECLVAAHVG